MGTVKTYIKIPQGFAEANDQAQRGLDKFAYGITINTPPIYFVDVNTVNTHADLFPSLEPLEYVEIDHDDVLMYDEDGNISTPNYVNNRSRVSFNIPEEFIKTETDRKIILGESKKWYQKFWGYLVKGYIWVKQKIKNF